MAAIPLLIGSIVALLASVLSYALTGMNAGQATMLYFAVVGAVCLTAFAWSRVSVRTTNTI